uniref:Uncharacterized protein n=1 Tax=viral metagenome TaxID=1070528 RepID=A0A6M3IDA1_9ZZZZ
MTIDGGGPEGLPEPTPSTDDITGWILSLAAQQLLDITGDGWDAATVLLPYLNLGIQEIINLKPDAYTETAAVALNGGPRNEVPSGAFRIIDAVCNLGADGVVQGKAITPLLKEQLDSIFPGWMQFTPTAPLETPAAATGTAATSGGSMADGTYYYVITAVNSYGETVAGTESDGVEISGGAGAGKITLSWTAISGATSYKIYRSTTSGTYATPALMGTATTGAYTDTALAASTGAPPTGSSSLTGVDYVVIDPRNPKVFYAFPVPVAPGIQKIQIVVSTAATEIDEVDGTFPLDDTFRPACVDYIIFRALAEETTIPGALAKSGAFWNKFLQDLGLTTNAEKQSEGKE